MHSHFQILLKGYMGLWENMGGGPLFSCFIAFLCYDFSKSFEGVHEVPPSSPPPCVHLWMKSSYNEKTKSILFYSVLFSIEVQRVVASSSCEGPMKTSKLKEEDSKTKVFSFEPKTKGHFSIALKLSMLFNSSQIINSFKIKCNGYLFEEVNLKQFIFCYIFMLYKNKHLTLYVE
jgi:hypothetical protein